MITIERDCPDLGATAALAAGFAALLKGGDVVTLSGELGAGKTTFVRSVVAGMGADESQVSSPTFVIVNKYVVPKGAIRAVSHVDAYRLHGTDELDNIGWDVFMRVDGAAPESVALIEWAERIAEAIPKVVARVKLIATGEESRRIVFELPDEWRARPELERFQLEVPRRCPTTGAWVAPGSASYPFANERARGSDLFGWLTERYQVSRPIEETDELPEE